jgi:hypothetical protein
MSEVFFKPLYELIENLPESVEKTACLRKLSEAKDYFVRANNLGMTEYKGNTIGMHPNELVTMIKDYIDEHSDPESQMISFNIQFKFLNKEREARGFKDCKLNANYLR